MKNSITALSLFLIFFGCVTNHHANDDPLVEIFKSDGSVQCEPNSGISLAEMELELVNSDIQTFGSRKDHDGLMRIQVCSAATGNINVFLIREADLLNAENDGFKKMKDSEMTRKK